ncbi:error-prone DNA polymerase [Eoetvoesiella caeni]|uniref:Error-prone DNA polymerase n=1 Tax=Eoetvoesiella caeni TaxID=645616 RepID=A0A366HG55_9BURK|nr:error-prone DNA polymerase [Eoetvoesiella caeni]MCI2808759.1 error-prone DNA polymerase [Eoetvoesiella caeni]NYT55300.1 error-prone DNA polymerase [Eoetvoesiella caeni]RBP40718.1 error-prone DNA polymerase [Eoetvoesiella caeni]
MSTPPQASILDGYAELDCLSNFSFLKGASQPEELVHRAAELGYAALALSDDCSLAGVVRAHVAVKQINKEHYPDFKLIIGSRFFLQAPQMPPLQIIALASNVDGYGNLSEFITLVRMRSPQKGQYTLEPDQLYNPGSGYQHLCGLPNCQVILVPEYGIGSGMLRRQIGLVQPAFPGRLWLGLGLQHRHNDAQHLATIQQAGQTHGLPITAIGQAEMHSRSRQPMHDTLTAIRLHETIGQCGYALKSNAEHHLRSRSRLMRLYPRQTLLETLRIASLCTFNLDEIRYLYPTEAGPGGMTPRAYLHQETLRGARQRYPAGIPENVLKQVESELDIITGLRYESYFLTVYDLVMFARERGILCQGRGSAANSAVCYCLGITEVNPENGNTLFARFISTDRNEPPDIDVDFEHQRREEVIQYVYNKYGRQRAALTAVVTTYRTRSAVRDTGKALGIGLDLVDRIARSFEYWDGQQSLLEKMAEQGLEPNSHTVQAWAALAQTLKGFPRHLSQHPGGFVVSSGKLTRLVPIENAAMPDRSVVQWDKDDLDAMGLLKVDVLALGMLSALRRTLELAGQRRGHPFTMQNVPDNDEETFDMICQADTVGVFQIESRAQMSMLPRLKPRSFYDLVIQIAIVRPGPIHGDMVHPYLRRRQGVDTAIPASPKLEHILNRTLGIPIFQEQVMQIAMVAADFSPGEADELRRSMAAWKRKGTIDKLRPKLIAGMKKNGYPSDFIEAIYRQLEGFGEYGFPESHSASFAKLAYLSAWLKRHEPEAFLAALLNSQPMGFYSASQLVQDARRHNVRVLPVDVVHSTWESQFAAPQEENGDARARPAVRLGLHMVAGLSQEAGLRIEAARSASPFASTQDLARRAQLSRHDMDALASADALLILSGHRRIARWEAANMPLKGLLRAADIPETAAPTLAPPPEQEHITNDYRALGLSLRRHPVALLRPALEARRFVPAAVLQEDYPDNRLARACGIVTMRQRPQTAKGIVFVSLEDETGPVNVIVRPELVERQRLELVQSQLLGVYGVWQRKSGICHLLASRLVDLSSLLGELSTRSRDFH